MPEIELNDSDRHFLRQCPQTISVVKGRNASRNELDKLKCIQRLQAARLIRGELDPDTRAGQQVIFMRISLTDAGRVAIGLPIMVSAS